MFFNWHRCDRNECRLLFEIILVEDTKSVISFDHLFDHALSQSYYAYLLFFFWFHFLGLTSPSHRIPRVHW